MYHRLLVGFCCALVLGAGIGHSRIYRTGLIPEELSRTAPENEVKWVLAKPGGVNYRDMPRIDLSDEIPPVGDQGDQGSCACWAFGYYHRSQLEYRERRWDLNRPEHQFSPAFIYNQINGGAELGTYFSQNGLLLCEQGCASLADCPYDQYDYTSWPSESAYSHAIPFRAKAWAWMYVRDSIELGYVKQLLCEGSTVVLAINCWENFLNIHQYNNAYCVADRYGRNWAGHGVVIVGYDDTLTTRDGRGAVKLVNSWGTEWGSSGFCWMSYSAVIDNLLSQRAVAFLVDTVGYQPQLLARVRVEHPTRERVYLQFRVGPREAPLWARTYRDWRWAAVDHPFPDNSMVLDISEAAPYIANLQTDSVHLVCRDDLDDTLVGEIRHLSCQYLPWGNIHVSTETPVPIPRRDTLAFAGARIRRVDNDVGTVCILCPSGIVGPESTYTPRALVRNFGLNPASFSVRLSIGPVYADSSAVPNLAPGDSAVVEFQTWTAPVRGTCPVRCTTALAGDQFPGNDLCCGTACVFLRDVAVIAITSPPDTADSGRVARPQVRVRNNGTQSESFSLSFRIPDEDYLDWMTLVRLLPPNRETLATLRPWIPRFPGSHAIYCSLFVTDMDSTNNTIDGSVFVRSAGIEEAMNDERRTPNVVPTIIRGVLLLEPSAVGRQSSAVFLDISGRKVMDLVPGENDIRLLSPGIYFVRAVGGEPSAAGCRKVIVTR